MTQQNKLSQSNVNIKIDNTGIRTWIASLVSIIMIVIVSLTALSKGSANDEIK